MDVIRIEYLRSAFLAEVDALEAGAFTIALPEPMRTASRSRRREPGVRLVAVSAEHVVGYVTGAWFYGSPPVRGSRSLYIVALAVDEPHRRMGLGRQLLATLFERASARGARNYRLQVQVENAVAIALYQSMGFEVQERQADAYGPGEHGLLMVRLKGRL